MDRARGSNKSLVVEPSRHGALSLFSCNERHAEVGGGGSEETGRESNSFATYHSKMTVGCER